MVTLQILDLSFLVRIQVAQQIREKARSQLVASLLCLYGLRKKLNRNLLFPIFLLYLPR